jgi:hypothetical protein
MILNQTQNDSPGILTSQHSKVSGIELTVIVYKIPAGKSENVPAKQKYMMKNYNPNPYSL